ncbi:hypothetical protein [Paenibacillus piri]|uniref:Uncharacterized protein n=1 Tax=Paenibacillus piri TaxID=2547395 RepID=A0A4V2ZSZ5_9BACL|nr:hypothetical protein [Paenibacillus piri]TDF95104.1 hypothetical protein E1757_21450 [Paenibacillus piri]
MTTDDVQFGIIIMIFTVTAICFLLRAKSGYRWFGGALIAMTVVLAIFGVLFHLEAALHNRMH